MQFTSLRRARSIICVGLVVLSHLAVIFTIGFKNKTVNQAHPIALTVTIISETNVTRTAMSPAKSSKPVSSSSTFIQQKPTPKTADLNPDSDQIPVEPHLDLDAMRAQAVEQEIGREKSPVELMNEAQIKNQSLESNMVQAAEKAQRPDCRSEYAGSGLFAALFIAADLMRDKGCKF